MDRLRQRRDSATAVFTANHNGAHDAENCLSRGTALPGCQLQRTASRRASEPHEIRFSNSASSRLSSLWLALGDAGTPHRRAERLPRRRLTKQRLRCCHAPASLWSGARESSSRNAGGQNAHCGFGPAAEITVKVGHEAHAGERESATRSPRTRLPDWPVTT